jgi:hypothetical protein
MYDCQKDLATPSPIAIFEGKVFFVFFLSKLCLQLNTDVGFLHNFSWVSQRFQHFWRFKQFQTSDFIHLLLMVLTRQFRIWILATYENNQNISWGDVVLAMKNPAILLTNCLRNIYLDFVGFSSSLSLCQTSLSNTNNPRCFDKLVCHFDVYFCCDLNPM